MTDLNLLNFAVLFTFCPREKRLLQVVLRVMALKKKKKALLFCCLFFSSLFQWFYQGCISALLGVPVMKYLKVFVMTSA